MTVLVTGATGSVGAHVARALAERGAAPRAFARDRGAAARVLGPDVEVAVGDFGDGESLRAAMRGVEQVFLTCANHPRQVEWEKAAIDAAATAGVRRVVKQSALGAEVGSRVAFFDANARIAENLRASGLAFVLLEPAFKMSNLFAGADAVRQAGALFLPGAGAKVAMVDPRDVAEVAAAVLTSDGHDGRRYELTGPEAVTFDDVAEQLSTVVGRPVGFVPVSDDAAVEQMVGAGVPEWFATNVVTQFGLLREGTQAEAQDVVRVLTGREPRTVADFLRDHADVFWP
jgi:uncharacterized protein YbjT (DUF2867 family)